MYNEEQLLEDLKKEILDEGVFSEDQIAALHMFASNLDYYINAKIENFFARNT